MFNQWVFYSSSESNEIELLYFKMDKPTKEKKTSRDQNCSKKANRRKRCKTWQNCLKSGQT